MHRYLRDQMQLEADAREALPYVSRRRRARRPPPTDHGTQSIESCTKPLGPLRQSVFACLTCNPPPEKASDPYQAAGVCYSCSIQCHGEHTLVEIFNKRNFTCDCGTTRLPATNPCGLRVNPATNTKGGVHSEMPDANNKYNHNFRNRFCGCECDYDPFQQKGTMFQCLGLGTHDTGGCGEDWWHPGCVVGLGPNWFESVEKTKPRTANGNADGSTGKALATISEATEGQPAAAAEAVQEAEDEELPMPPGFPAEEDFEGFLCYKCVEAHPWIKRYAGTPGFLPAVYHKEDSRVDESNGDHTSKKRKIEDDEDDSQAKRVRAETDKPADLAAEGDAVMTTDGQADTKPPCKLDSLPPSPEGRLSLFLAESFRERFCRCAACFPRLLPHPQLLEEEETYEPPISEEGSEHGSTHGSGSLYERGESALRNVDRVRAIEGVMAYNHLKEQLTPFFRQFAESGQAISAEDIKEYFAKLRGDDQPAAEGEGTAESDSRREQSGY